VSLEEKLKQPVESVRRGELSQPQLIADLEGEMEVLRGQHGQAPKTDQGKLWREALEIYFEAVEYALDLLREDRLNEQDEWDNVYAICAEADDLIDELERA
jgi:hypothetical protein